MNPNVARNLAYLSGDYQQIQNFFLSQKVTLPPKGDEFWTLIYCGILTFLEALPCRPVSIVPLETDEVQYSWASLELKARLWLSGHHVSPQPHLARFVFKGRTCSVPKALYEPL